jgi:hypothetical protein
MAGIIQLACKGKQDTYLTSNPQITSFKMVYKRHTSFSSETVRNYFTTNPDFNGKYSCKISKYGDLLHKMHLVMTLPSIYIDQYYCKDRKMKVGWVRKVAFALVNSVELEIGDFLVEKHYGEWFNIWYELSTSYEQRYDKLIGLDYEINTPTSSKPSFELVLPLNFWFNRASRLALPLVSLTNQDVKINVEFNTIQNCIITSPTHYVTAEDNFVLFNEDEYICNGSGGVARFSHFDIGSGKIYYETIGSTFSTGANCITNTTTKTILKSTKEKTCPKLNLNHLHLNNVHILCEYIFVDQSERDKIIKKNMIQSDYLIEQVLFNDEKIFTSIEQIFSMKFSNMCSELIWVAQMDSAVQAKQYFNYTDRVDNSDNCGSRIIKKETVMLNSVERITFRSASYFDQIQPYQYHTSTSAGINLYSFSLHPEQIQPAGAINLELISNVNLRVRLNGDIFFKNKQRGVRLRTYAKIFNIFRIQDGAGAIVYANNNVG